MSTRLGWKRPLLPAGALRSLNDELHGLHALSGFMSSRNIAKAIADDPGLAPISHTTVRNTLSNPGLPAVEHVLSIVRVLTEKARNKNSEDELDRFDLLWQDALRAKDKAFESEDSGLDSAAAAVQRLHEQRLALLERQVAAEGVFIGKAAVLAGAESPDWRLLLEAYDQVKAWGLKGSAQRWADRVGYDRLALGRRARAMPPDGDGVWTGDTGWDGLDTSAMPPRGKDVVYALFDENDNAVHVGMTRQFRTQVKRLHQQGTSWEAWTAWPCQDRVHAVETRKEMADRYARG